MSGTGNGAADRAADRAAAEGRAQGLDTGWTVFSYLIGGMLAYGGIGWLIGRAVHVALLFPLGMLLGMAISIAYIIHRYGRGAGASAPGKGAPRRGAEGARGERFPPVSGGLRGVAPPGKQRRTGDR
jgi:ATP synthase protein I